MTKKITEGFSMQRRKPLDERTVVERQADLQNISFPYEGMDVYVKETKTKFQFDGRTWQEAATVENLTTRLNQVNARIDETAEEVANNVVAVIDTKANKGGYYPELEVGLADNIKPARGEKVEDTYLKRTTARFDDISDGNAKIKSIKGFTIKNLIPNGNFQNDRVGWSNYQSRAIIENTDDYISVTGTTDYVGPDATEDSSHLRIINKKYPTSTHRYYLSAKVSVRLEDENSYAVVGISNSQLDIPNKNVAIKINDNTPFTIKSVVKDYTQDDNYVLCEIGVKGKGTITLDKHYGIRLYDLTEMGCETKLPNGKDTNVENCEEFFSAYVEGIEGATPTKFLSKGANLFDKNSMVLNATRIDIDTDDLVEDSNFITLQVPVLKASVCKGYRIHGAAVKNVGWNAYQQDNGCFDGIKNIADIDLDTAGDCDYNANTMDGYLYIQVPANANLDNIVVHPKWSYTDEQLSEVWYEEMMGNKKIHKDYWVDELSLPLQYRDGEEVKTITALHGLQNGDTLYQDEIDLVNMKYIKRVGVYTFDGSEDTWWGNDGMFNVNCNINAIYLSTNMFQGLSNKYQPTKKNIINNTDIDKVFYTNVTAHQENKTFIRDNQYTTIADFKQSLADNPLTIYYPYVEQTYDLVVGEDFSGVYDVCDFGTEEFEGSNVGVTVTSEYLPNLVDKINNIGKYSELATSNKTPVGAINELLDKINELEQTLITLQPTEPASQEEEEE